MASRTPISEQRRLVARWRSSQQSVASFAETVGIPESTFYRWTRKYVDDGAVAPPAPAFIEVTAEPQVAEPVSIGLEVQGAPGLLLTFEGLPDPRWFGAVVREVIAC